MYAECGGAYVSEEMVDYFDRMQAGARSNRLKDPATRRAEHREDVVLRALLTVAGRSGDVEQAAFSFGVQRRDLPDEAARIAADHGFGPDRLIAMRGLARSRGLPLEVVLRAALRGALRDIVTRPAVITRPTGDGAEAG